MTSVGSLVERTYPPGSFILTKIQGRTGWWVGLAQAAVGIPSRWTHAAVVGYQGETFEAAPGGVVRGHVLRLADRPHIVCDAPVQEAVRTAVVPLTVGAREAYERRTRAMLVRFAEDHLGTGYSFLDYLALGLHHLTVPKNRHDLWAVTEGGRRGWLARWARRRVRDSGRLICSAFVDHVYAHAEINLYDDHRLHGDVTPADLDAWVDDHGFTVERQAVR